MRWRIGGTYTTVAAGRAEERGVLRQGGDGGYADTVQVAWLRRWAAGGGGPRVIRAVRFVLLTTTVVILWRACRVDTIHVWAKMQLVNWSRRLTWTGEIYQVRVSHANSRDDDRCLVRELRRTL
jgi:hypothetical protein